MKRQYIIGFVFFLFLISFSFATVTISNTDVEFRAPDANFSLIFNQTQSFEDNITIYNDAIMIRGFNWTFTPMTENVTLSVYNETNRNYTIKRNSPATISFNITGIPAHYYVEYDSIFVEGETDGVFDLDLVTTYKELRIVNANQPQLNLTFYNDQGLELNSTLNMSGEVNDPIHLAFNNYTDLEGSGTINISVINETGSVILSELIATNTTTVNSSDFTMLDYSVHNYTIIMTNGKSIINTYAGQINATNLQPNLTGIITFKGPVEGQCVKDATCSLYIKVDEDGCEQAYTGSIIIREVATSTLKLSDSTLTFVSEYDKNQCYLQTGEFFPSTVGLHNYSIEFTDLFSLTDNLTGTFSVAIPTSSSGGGGGGGSTGDTIIIGTNISEQYEITPILENVTMTPGGSRLVEFKITNTGLKDVELDLNIVSSSLNPEVAEWMAFEDGTKKAKVIIKPSEGLESNVAFMRYTIDVPKDIDLGNYVGQIMMSNGQIVNYQANISVEQSLFQFLNEELFFIGTEVCTDDAFDSNSAECLDYKKTGISITFFNILLLILVLFVSTIVIRNSNKKKK